MMNGHRVALACLAFACVGLFSPVLAAGGEGDAGSALMTPKWGIFIWTSVTFIIVLIVLSRVAWKPLLGALEEREGTIRDSLQQAQSDREEAAAQLAEHKQLVEEARRDRAEARERGQREAEQLKEQILGEARAERERMLEQSERQVEAAMTQARAEMRQLVVDLSIQAAEKLMVKNLDDPTQRRLVEDYLADLERGGQTPSA